MSLVRTLAFALVASSLSFQSASPATNFDVEKLTDNVYAVIRKDPPGLMVDANNVFIIKRDYVIVVDANGAPAITREVLAAIRRITNKPVRYVVNTHYHDDHIRGNQVYRDAFPNVQFVGHAFTREYLPVQGASNRKSFLEGAPDFVVQLRGLLETGKNLAGGSMTAEERESMTSDVTLGDFVLKNSATAETLLPSVVVDDRMTIGEGDPVVEVRHLGKGHTAADLIVHLPNERIAVTGDLVVWPVPLVGDPQSHIGAWSQTLDALRNLGASTFVPGHGPVLRDDRYISTLSRMFASIRQQAGDAVRRGETIEQARKSIHLDEFRTALAGDSSVRRMLFGNYVARPAIGAAFKEAIAGK